jgi:hypothetical protein
MFLYRLGEVGGAPVFDCTGEELRRAAGEERIGKATGADDLVAQVTPDRRL